MDTRFLTVIILALALAACGTSSGDIARPEPRPLGREFIPLSAPPSGTAGIATNVREQVSSFADEPSGTMTLRQALALSLVKNPDLTAFSYDNRAAEARTLQAGYRPNPEISALTEDFGGNHGRGGFQQAQSTLSLSQVVELGSKRAHRLRLARLDESLAAWDYETKRLDVFVEVTKAFVTVLAAQRKREIADTALRTEQQFYTTVNDRVQAGKVSPIEQRRADVTLANGRIAVEKAIRELNIARDKLAALWAAREARFTRAEGDLNNVAPPPPLQRLVSLSTQNPDIARWTTEIEQREARVNVERSKQIPNITLQGGVRHYGEGGSAFVAGIGVPLPLFDTNRGNIGEAQMQLNKGRAQQQAAEVRTGTALRQSFQQLSGAYDEVVTLRRDVLPAAEAAFTGTSIGYRDGKFGLLEVLDARRAQSDAQTRLVDALSAYQAALAEVERLIGQSLRDDFPTRAGGKR